MKNELIAILIFWGILSSLTSGGYPTAKGKEKKFPGIFKQDVIVDGKANEWNDSLFLLKTDAGVSFAVVNDSSHLFFCIRIVDEGQQMKALKEGMEIAVDPGGKKGKVFDIQYPLSTTMIPVIHPGAKPGNQKDYRTAKLLYILQAKDMELTGFRNEYNGLQSNSNGKGGAKAIIALDSANVLVCEIMIPLRLFTRDLADSNPLSAGIIIHGMTQPKKKEGENPNENGAGDPGNNRSGQRPGGQQGMGQSPESNFHGDGPGPGSNDKMFQEVSLWRKFSLIR